MPVRDLLKKKVPLRTRQGVDYRLFCKWISDRDIQTASQLKKELDREISREEQRLKELTGARRAGTNTRVCRACAKKLDFLKRCKRNIVKYL
ncbi:hypothetical protein D6825_02800 [Candidatus Woesearchaeota archaeon]|nr:MAG: hypothetical protein D6825_02800 [Candidatus Woesearchaeota archaeon]